MSTLWLTPDEVKELTDKCTQPAQCRALIKMGIPFIVNAIGRPLVERAKAVSEPAPAKRRKREPNWRALNGSAA